MSTETIQDILPFVQKPSRYLGTEINAVHKNPADAELKLVLAFPDLYEIGTSHFGMQILYHLLNNQQKVMAERVFAPARDYAEQLKTRGLSLTSLESRTPLARFDIIGFSLLYELNYTNVLSMLALADIPLESSRRNASHPLIIAGGPCTCNPEPVADFFDALVIGDGEETLLAMARTWLGWNRQGQKSRKDLLRDWAGIRGVYIPSLCGPEHPSARGTEGNPEHHFRKDSACQVTRAIIPDLDSAEFPTRPVVPFGRPVHDRLRMELARGCTRGCRFCQAGMLYRPVRERSPATILDLTRRAQAATGYDDISLLSLSTGDYGCIETVLEQLMTSSEGNPTAVSLPSLRAGSISPRMMELIKRVRKTGFTLAPEAGTQRLRDVINKNISDEDIIETVTQAFGLGWKVIKLYFMIGLPTETDADLDGILQLVERVRGIKGPGKKRSQINVSVTTFIPKPFTPFQWAPQLPLDESRRRIEYLHRRLKRPGLKFKWQPPEVSYLEGLWARGDRRLAPLLKAAWRRGCQFDGWSDHFRFDLWQQALAEVGLDADFFVTRSRDVEETLPWDHIDIGVSKAFLSKEWQRAHRTQGAVTTPDCRTDDCAGCGVCDFKTLQPRVFKPGVDDLQALATTGKRGKPNYCKIHIRYSKLEDARFLGHLEMVNIFNRALRRAGIPVKYSEGFHPKPKISFTDALPIGIESRSETMIITARADLALDTLPQKINPHLPPGLKVLKGKRAPAKGADIDLAGLVYGIYLSRGTFSPAALDVFKNAENYPVTKKSAKGKLKTIDLKIMIEDIRICSPQELRLVFRRDGGVPPRPAIILAHIFRLDPVAVQTARMIKYPD